MRLGPIYGLLDAHQPLNARAEQAPSVRRENLIDAGLSAAAASAAIPVFGTVVGRVAGGAQVARGLYQGVAGGFNLLGAAFAGASASGNNARAGRHTLTAGVLNIMQGTGNLISPEFMFPVNVAAAGKDGLDALLAPWSLRR